MKLSYKSTINACFLAYIVQAIINNFTPLLFITFQREYNIELSKITLLITMNFLIQLSVDLVCAKAVDKVGYRASMIIAHILSAVGLVSLAVLPGIMKSAFAGLVISVIVYAIGGGILEVLVSPVMEACPTDNKEKAMSLLHSFYCWGHVGVVLISTLFFRIFGIENWKILAIIWAVIPLVNSFVFAKVPIARLVSEDEKGMSIKELCTNKLFILLFVMMVCAGASEQAVSQWASAYAQQGLNVSKTVGDLAGPLSFAVLMGTSRAIYGKFGDKFEISKAMTASTVLCIASYLLISLSPTPVLSLIGCALCGLSVGIMWPGTFSLSAKSLPKGSTAMFALLALGGDLGCCSGPSVVGFVSSRFSDSLNTGILSSIIFPILLIISLLALGKTKIKAE
ncbi:MAG: MFS transporter [Eubacteriales bacterium]|nr:MFS transporter [Eubacteriales bacterium]